MKNLLLVLGVPSVLLVCCGKLIDLNDGNPESEGGAGGTDGKGGQFAEGASPPLEAGATNLGGEGGANQGGAFGSDGGAGEGGESGNSEGCETSPDGCTTTIELGKPFRFFYEQQFEDLAASASGGFTLSTSSVFANLDFGAPTSVLEPEGGWDAFLVKLETNGQPTWSASVAGEGDQHVYSIAFDPRGDLVATGFFWTGELDGAMLLAKFDDTGDVQWMKTFAGVEGYEIASGPDGEIAVAGYCTGGVLDLGGESTSCSYPSMFVAEFDADGDLIWQRPFVAWSSDPGGVTFDSDGNVVAVGQFQESIDFGEGAVSGGEATSLFLAKFSSSGSLVFANTYWGNGNQELHGVAVDSSNNIVITGELDGTLSFKQHSVDGSNAGYVAKFDPSGKNLWAKPIESTNDVRGMDVAVDSSDNIVVGGDFRGTLEAPVSYSAAKDDGFVAKFSPQGDWIWDQAIGGTGQEFIMSIAVDGDDNVYAGGQYWGTIDFGDDSNFPESDRTDLFVVTLAP